MAGSSISKGKPRLAAVGADEKGARERFTRTGEGYSAMTMDIRAATAVMDAAAVLTALHNAPQRGGLSELDGVTGAGYADGYMLRDATLPDLLKHGMWLLDRVEIGAGEVFEAFRTEAGMVDTEVHHG